MFAARSARAKRREHASTLPPLKAQLFFNGFVGQLLAHLEPRIDTREGPGLIQRRRHLATRTVHCEVQ